MAKPNSIELPDCEPIPILYEDRSALAIDKPPGWMFLPVGSDGSDTLIEKYWEGEIE